MITIFKYPLEIVDQQQIATHEDHEILHVGLDAGNIPCVWIQVDTSRPPESFELSIVGTGRPVPKGAAHYVGTFLHGPFVWHVYR